jgi:hypothetical protein
MGTTGTVTSRLTSPRSGRDETRVVAALEQYLAAAESGRPIGREEFLGMHPEIARELAACLDGL